MFTRIIIVNVYIVPMSIITKLYRLKYIDIK